MKLPTAATFPLALAPLVAGCLSPDEARGFQVSGSFTGQATQAQMDELGDYARARGGDLLLMESFPVRFRATGLDEASCEEARAYADGRAYVAEVGACGPEPEPTDDPEQPVGNGTA